MEIAPGVYRAEGPTPNGGAYSLAYFQDAAGQPAPKELAARVEIHEMNEAGEIIFRTYAELPAPPESSAD